MNKIEQMMLDQIGTGQNTLTLHIAKDCASLTEKLMCGFADWCGAGYLFGAKENGVGLWISRGVSNQHTYTTAQLLELYKETL